MNKTIMVSIDEKTAICDANYIHDMNVVREPSGLRQLLEAIAGFGICLAWFLILLSM